MELKRLDSDLKKLYDNNLVDLISGYLMPVGTGPVPFFFGRCRSQETLYYKNHFFS